MECDYFNEQRKSYIKSFYTRRPNTYKVNMLMTTSNRTTIRNLCTFIEIIMKTVSAYHINESES